MKDLLTRAATLEPATYSKEAGTVEVVFSTGADVLRYDLEGSFIERLDMSPAAVKLDRIKGAPVLDHHNRFSVDSVLGVVESAATDGTRGIATIRFGTRPKAAGIAQDVAAGVIRNVSAGYRVAQWAVSRRSDGVRIKTAVDWTPVEISLVTIAADSQATVRSHPEESMNPQEQYRSIAEALGVPPAFADGLSQRNANLTEARAAIIAEAQRLSPPIEQRAPAHVTRETSPEDYARAAGEALCVRVDAKHEVPELGRQFTGRRMADIARELLRLRGADAQGTDAQIIARSLTTTSDLANVVGVFANKTLAAAYQAAEPALKTVCKRSTVADFKPKTIIGRGELPALLKVNEHGEFKRGSIVDGREGYSIDTYGRVFGMSRQLLVNDDLGALSNITAGWGQSANEFENQFLVDKLNENSGYGPTLEDGHPVFHTAHANIVGSPDFSAATLTVARRMMRQQKGLDGKTPINVTPRYLVVPSTLEDVALKYLASIHPTNVLDVNTWAGSNISLVVDPRLDAESEGRWYMFADPAIVPVLEYAYLQGEEGVQVETRNGFDVDGVEIRARLDFGAGGVDFRGAVVAETEI